MLEDLDLVGRIDDSFSQTEDSGDSQTRYNGRPVIVTTPEQSERSARITIYLANLPSIYDY